jgi:beta-lactamase class A
MRPSPIHLVGAAILACWAVAAAAKDGDPKNQLLLDLRRIEESSGGRLGVSAFGVKTGERVQFNADARYPMASTFKVPVAILLLESVDRGAISLSQKIEVDNRNLSPGSGELNKTMDPEVPKASTVGDLLEGMMHSSDNTATDHLMAMIGGPKAVTGHLRKLGVDDIDVSRPASQLVADSWGFKLPPPGERTRKALVGLLNKTPQAAREKAAQRFLEDARDTATPDAMVALLDKLAAGKALKKESTAVLLDHMANCKTGPKRIKGELPRGMPVAHKTGTLTRVTTNDVGIITLPWSGGPLIVAIFLSGSPQPLAQQERAIAQASLALYRYYTR